MSFHFTIVTLQHVEIATIQTTVEVVDGFYNLNLEDKVLNWDEGIVKNQAQPNVDTNVI